MSATIGVMNGQDFGPGDTCNGQPPLHAIIGESESSATVILSRTTGPFKIPVISPSATCECLSNRKDYSSFFRTIASDYHQSRALAYIVKHFGWSWVGAVNSDNDYGNNGMSVFLKIAQDEGICIEYSVKFYRTEPEKLKKVVDTIKKGTAKVIVAFVSFVEMGLLIDQLSIQNIAGFQIIGVESWITTKNYITPNSFHSLGGSLGFAVRKNNIKGFTDYVIKEFWDTTFPCSQSEGNSSQYASNCSRYEDLLALKNYNEDVPEQRYASNVYKAVYAVAHSLHSLLKCKEQEGCEKSLTIQPQEVVEALKNVNFTIKMGDHVWFDSTGGAVAQYEVVNWQQDSDGSFQFKSVGYYDASLPPFQRLVLNQKNIIWTGGQLKKPSSVCSESCPPGTRKAAQKGRPVCCYDCIACAEGEISNETAFRVYGQLDENNNPETVGGARPSQMRERESEDYDDDEEGENIEEDPADVCVVIEGTKVLNGCGNRTTECILLMGLIYMASTLSIPKTFEVFQKLFLELDGAKLLKKVSSLKCNLMECAFCTSLFAPSISLPRRPLHHDVELAAGECCSGVSWSSSFVLTRSSDARRRGHNHCYFIPRRLHLGKLWWIPACPVDDLLVHFAHEQIGFFA
ncbi:hypothetical protein QQF64_012096 [Cirrhinus molitorella]|uniref:Extracellular calcium-sensing receptor n=1 Tax=Cirrhinus molitorella TaxID=172907 RepID=A0ABR3LUH7_9TELE